MKELVFIDLEVGAKNHNIYDLGAVKEDGTYFHGKNIKSFLNFAKNAISNDLVVPFHEINGFCSSGCSGNSYDIDINKSNQ